MSSDGKTPHPVDLYVGARLRSRRRVLRLSQSDVADAIGRTFQQVQKYERGANRISVSTLFKFARVLDVPVTYFFNGYSDMPETADLPLTERKAVDFLTSSDGLELAKSFSRISSAKLRRRMLELVRTLADEAGEPLLLD